MMRSYTRSSCSRSEEHTSELQSPCNLVCRLLLEKKKETHCRPSSAVASTAPVRMPATHLTPAARAVARVTDCQTFFFFFFNDPAPTEIYTLSLHDALPI